MHRVALTGQVAAEKLTIHVFQYQHQIVISNASPIELHKIPADKTMIFEPEQYAGMAYLKTRSMIS